MAKVKTIKIKMTNEQMKAIQPLFDIVNEHPGEGFIIGQVWRHGWMMVGYTTPSEVKHGMESTIAKNKTDKLLSSYADEEKFESA